MNTETQKRTWHDVDIKGQWKLVYKVGNSQGPSAFGGYHLPVYPNPFTGQKTFLKNVDNKALNGWLIDKPQVKLMPDQNPNQKYLISWLICHPEVAVEGVKDLPQEILAKKESGKIKLIYMDFQEIDKYEEEDYQDKLIGLLSLELGKNAISLSKLRYIMAYLNLAYRDPRFESSAEKKSLRSKLKSFVRSSYINAQLVNKAIENIEEAQNTYEFKELVRLKIIQVENGVYKFQHTPLGTNQESVNGFFTDHPEVRTSALKKLYKN